MHTLSVGERQRVEIVRCLLQTPELLIMDEPTSVLTPQAVGKLFETLRRLAAEGCTILYISHKLDEIRALCDRATVLRAGRVTGNCDPRRQSSADLARMMIGNDLPHPQHRAARRARRRLLEVRNLSLAADDPFGTDLERHRSQRARRRDRRHRRRLRQRPEGTAGRAVGRAPGRRGGRDRRQRRLRPAGSTRRARRALGFAFVPEERLGRGAVPEMSLADNALLTAHRTAAGHAAGPDRRRAVRAFAQATIATFDVKAGGPEAAARSLSGGNLQKFIVGREILQQPHVMIVAQPTWGVDVGAAAQIRQALIDLRDAGVAVLRRLRGARRAVRDLRPARRDRAGPPVAGQGRYGETNAEEIGLLMSGSFVAAPGTCRSLATRDQPCCSRSRRGPSRRA